MAGKAEQKLNDLDPDQPDADNTEQEAPLEIADGLTSPARRLQSYLENTWDERASEEFIEDRWSTRRMIAFVFISCALFWALVLYIGQAIF